MKIAPYDYILKIVQQTNILPVTSSCTTGCVFCSHKNNPSDIEVYALPDLSFEQIKEIAGFLDKNQKIVIGESASRITEGEPFLRRDMTLILEFLRQSFPTTPIEVTTSGTYLTLEVIKELKSLQPIEINISLNSSTEQGRIKLHRDKNLHGAVAAVKYMKEIEVPFHGSIVAMPHVVGYKDIEDTISYLCSHGAQTVRVFVPGFSGFSRYSIDFFEVRNRLNEIANNQYKVHKIPILVEPPEITDLKPKIEGIIKGSPAEKSGLMRGDIIQGVDDYIPLTRVDGFNFLYKKSNPEVLVKRGDEFLNIVVEKSGNQSSGVVFYYDIDPEVVYDIEKEVYKNRSKKPLIISSYLGYPVIELAIKELTDVCFNIIKVENSWFGGSIMCGGLLTVGNIIDGIKNSSMHKNADLIIIPSLPFDSNGRDLSGHYFYEIEDELGIKTVMV